MFGTEAAIPPTCGSLSFRHVEFFGESDLDVGFRYQGPSHIRADAYLCRRGNVDRTDKLNSLEFKQWFQDAYYGVFMVAEAGIYLDLEVLDSQLLCRRQ